MTEEKELKGLIIRGGVLVSIRKRKTIRKALPKSKNDDLKN